MLLKLWAPLANFTPPLLLLEDTITTDLCAWSGGIPPIRVGAGSRCCTFVSPQERMALERRMPTKLSALKDRLIAAFDKSLYLSSHSREMAWVARLETKGKYTLEKLEHFKEAFTKRHTNSMGTAWALCSCDTAGFFTCKVSKQLPLWKEMIKGVSPRAIKNLTH